MHAQRSMYACAGVILAYITVPRRVQKDLVKQDYDLMGQSMLGWRAQIHSSYVQHGVSQVEASE